MKSLIFVDKCLIPEVINVVLQFGPWKTFHASTISIPIYPSIQAAFAARNKTYKTINGIPSLPTVMDIFIQLSELRQIGINEIF